MEENRKGTGVFYAVVGVATLVVAIIGATFAYFSASNQDNTNITGTTAGAGGLTVVAAPVTQTGTNMVPLNVTTGNGEKDTVAQLSPALKAACVDSNGNNVCQIYKITVTNLSETSTITVQGRLNLAGTKTANLKWQLLDSTYATTGVAPEYATIVSQGNDGDLTVAGNSKSTVGGTVGTGKTKASNVMAPKAAVEYYVMVWLEEMGTAQEANDAGGSFLGTAFFSAVDAQGVETGTTATFTSGV